MKGILLLNGEPYRGEIEDSSSLVFCCDGAYAWAKGKVRIDENVGDFDSLPYLPEPKPLTIYPSEKNYTDGEIALFKLIDRGVDEVLLYGGGGGRADHFLGNLHLLYAAWQRGVSASMINNDGEIRLGAGKMTLDGLKGKTVSVLPFGKDALVTRSQGMKYPLIDLKLEYGTCRGISNVVTSDRAWIESADTVLVFVNNEI
ncbi:MAG: thiamine diphosphokinase [Clostridia bacterium]|nr:thiamine diphosphokinase [Clostridia bacterium]